MKFKLKKWIILFEMTTVRDLDKPYILIKKSLNQHFAQTGTTRLVKIDTVLQIIDNSKFSESGTKFVNIIIWVHTV